MLSVTPPRSSSTNTTSTYPSSVDLISQMQNLESSFNSKVEIYETRLNEYKEKINNLILQKSDLELRNQNLVLEMNLKENAHKELFNIKINEREEHLKKELNLEVEKIKENYENEIFQLKGQIEKEKNMNEPKNDQIKLLIEQLGEEKTKYKELLYDHNELSEKYKSLMDAYMSMVKLDMEKNTKNLRLLGIEPK